MTRKTAQPNSSTPPREAANVVLAKSAGGMVARKPEESPKTHSRPDGATGPALVTAEIRRLMIAEAAYYMSEHRGFSAERAMEDWLLAEKQIDALLSGAAAAAQPSQR